MNCVFTFGPTEHTTEKCSELSLASSISPLYVREFHLDSFLFQLIVDLNPVVG